KTSPSTVLPDTSLPSPQPAAITPGNASTMPNLPGSKTPSTEKPSGEVDLKQMSAAEFLDWAACALQTTPGRVMDLWLVTKMAGPVRMILALDEQDIERVKH
ncbi:MAG TPA: hypothetical protein VE222_12330, partial [Nitrospiraceae bacterium]|nr:hypothetical protein [Nitrospiraceae bacterium]